MDDAYGDVKGGIIRLRCQLPVLATVVEEITLQVFRVDLQGHYLFWIMCLDRAKKHYYAGEDIYILPLVSCVDLEDEPMICRLVIESVQPASYQRTGYFRTMGNPVVQQFLDAQKLNSYEDKNFIGEALDIVNKDGIKLWIITLI